MNDFALARRMMVDGQVRTSDVTNPAVQAAMLTLPRELFMPPGKEDLAYLDLAAPVGAARRLLKPMVLGKLLQALEIQPGERVLNVGCGTGYSAAVLSHMGASVVGLEEHPELAQKAGQALARAGITGVEIVSGPLLAGWPAGGPYDAVLLEGATELRPSSLSGQLKESGRLACVLGAGPAGKAMLYRQTNGELSGRPVFDAAADVLPGFAEHKVFVF